MLRIPEGMALDAAAPLLCAGITTYSPIRHFGGGRRRGRGRRPRRARPHGGEVPQGAGRARHRAQPLAGKREDAARLGADDFVVTSDDDAFDKNAERFDFILDTVSAAHDYNAYLRMLRRDGTMVIVGLPDPWPLEPGALINGRRRLAGSVIGGIPETQEMLDFCAERGIVSDIEMIPIQQVNEAYERTLKSDVRYRFVIDLASLRGGQG